jgi:hypothetical protein
MADLIELYLLGELGFLPLFFLYFDLADLGFDFDLPDLDGLTGLSESPELTFFGLPRLPDTFLADSFLPDLFFLAID